MTDWPGDIAPLPHQPREDRLGARLAGMVGRDPRPEEHYSDDALAKQAEAERLRAARERVPLALMVGILEPRIQPTAEERCNCCGLDARESEGGEQHNDLRWCYICVGRGHHEDDA